MYEVKRVKRYKEEWGGEGEVNEQRQRERQVTMVISSIPSWPVYMQSSISHYYQFDKGCSLMLT